MAETIGFLPTFRFLVPVGFAGCPECPECPELPPIPGFPTEGIIWPPSALNPIEE